jgi:lipoprotein signal peptidase
LDWGLQFNKFVKELNVNAYLTRMNATNFGNIQDRLFGGSTVDLMQSNHLSIAYNLAALFDVKGTALDTNVFSNIVNTMTFRYNNKIGKLTAQLQGEF